MTQQLDALIATVLEIPPAAITAETKQGETPSWTSMRHLELVVSLEEAYGVSFSTEEIVAMSTVERIRSTLAAKGIAA